MTSAQPPEDIPHSVEPNLDAEARDALADAQEHMPAQAPPTSTLDGPPTEDDETEGEILSRALAEAALEGEPTASAEPEDEEAEITFPSIPSALPPPIEDDDDTDTARRLNALSALSGPPTQPGKGLPSVPSSAPSAPKYDLPGYDQERDEDMNSWCCELSPQRGESSYEQGICTEDAVVVCTGCEGDPYCLKCWRWGHGDGPGQERGHKVKKLVWRRKGRPIGA